MLCKALRTSILVATCLLGHTSAGKIDIPNAFDPPDGNDICENGACIHQMKKVVIKKACPPKSGNLQCEREETVLVDTEKAWKLCGPGLPFISKADYYTECEGIASEANHDKCHFKKRKFLKNGKLRAGDSQNIAKNYASLLSKVESGSKFFKECSKWDGNFGDYYVEAESEEIESKPAPVDNSDPAQDTDSLDDGTFDDDDEEDDLKYYEESEMPEDDLELAKRDTNDERLDILSLLDLSPETISAMRSKRSPGNGNRGSNENGKKPKKNGNGRNNNNGKSGKRGKKTRGQRNKDRAKGGKKGNRGGSGAKASKEGRKKRREGKNKNPGKVGKRRNDRNGGNNEKSGGKRRNGGNNKNGANKNNGGKITRKTLNKAWCYEMAVKVLFDRCIKDNIGNI